MAFKNVQQVSRGKTELLVQQIVNPPPSCSPAASLSEEPCQAVDNTCSLLFDFDVDIIIIFVSSHLNIKQ